VTQPSRHILEQIATLSSEGILVIDASEADYRVVYVNPAYETLTGYSAEETVGRPWRVLDTDGEDPPATAALRVALGSADNFVADLPDIRNDGTTWLSRTRVQPILTRRGELRQYLVLQAEITEADTGQTGVQMGLLQRELSRARKKAASLDRIDPASGILRYEYFLELADRDCQIARRDGELIGVAFIEINDLDTYRQTFGAKAADSCVRMIAAQVTVLLRRAGDICGCEDGRRIVALTQGQDIEKVTALTDRVATNVRRLGLHNPRGRSGRYVTVNVGVAVGKPSSADYLKTLIDEARTKLGRDLETADASRSARG
jgi:diguanylate cyclase (GGDEF)-like protein/PAS domain S-box-containing protein